VEVLGRLLAVHNVLQLLSGPQQAAEFATRTLRILPEVLATGAILDGFEASEGAWGPAWEVAQAWRDPPAGPEWRSRPDQELLIVPVRSVWREHGRLAVLVAERAAVDRYVPYLGNFASALALALDNRRQQAELEAASESLRRSERSYRQLFSRMTHGFALHEIITDDTGAPVDYRFLEANPAFETITGLRRDDVVGRTAREVLPDLESSWIERFGVVALDGEAIEFESFSTPLDRHYGVIAYSPEPGRFATIFSDVTERRATEQALRASEVAAAAQEERSRLARDLHDSVTQALFAASLKAEVLSGLADVSPDAGEVVRQVQRLTGGALSQMRAMLLELRGEPLDSIPIRQLLRNVVEATESRTRTEVQLTVEGEGTLSTEVHTAVYRITQEALNNVARHAGAGSAFVDLELSPERVRLSVRDDGCGFDPGFLGPEHLGLRSMRERAAEVGARLEIEAAPGEGTRVVFEWEA